MPKWARTAKDVASASSSRCSLVLSALESVLVQKLVRQFVGQRAALRGGGECRVDNDLPALAPAVRRTRLLAILQHDTHGGGCGFKAGQKSFASSLGAVFKLGNVLAFGVGDVEDVGDAEPAQLHRGNPLGCAALARLPRRSACARMGQGSRCPLHPS